MNFDISRLRRADRVIGISAVLFFIFLFFFKWFGYSSNVSSIAGIHVGGTSISANGWHTFTNSRWLWIITIIVALLTVAISAGMFEFESPVSLGAVVTGLGALSSLFILYRIVHHPSASATIGSFHASVGIKIGIWLGLIAALGVTYGGYLAMQEERASPGAVHDHGGATVTDLPGSPAPSPAAAEEPAAPVAPSPQPPSPPPGAPPIPPPAGEAPGGSPSRLIASSAPALRGASGARRMPAP